MKGGRGKERTSFEEDEKKKKRGPSFLSLERRRGQYIYRLT